MTFGFRLTSGWASFISLSKYPATTSASAITSDLVCRKFATEKQINFVEVNSK